MKRPNSPSERSEVKYVADTNIISEFMNPRASDSVINWAQDFGENLFITTLTVMEINYGIMRLPDSKRTRTLRKQIDAIMNDCTDRVLEFDGYSAYLCAQLRCSAAAAGRTPQLTDCMIAAICQRNEATLVTRNVKDFECFGINIVNPFEYESPTLVALKARKAEFEES